MIRVVPENIKEEPDDKSDIKNIKEEPISVSKVIEKQYNKMKFLHNL